MSDRKKVFRGDRLREIREARGLTQDDLTKRLGFGLNQVNKYETGLSEPNPAILVRFVKALDITADYLLGLTDDANGYFEPEKEEFSPMEHKLISALRAGHIVEALEVVTELAKSGS